MLATQCLSVLCNGFFFALRFSFSNSISADSGLIDSLMCRLGTLNFAITCPHRSCVLSACINEVEIAYYPYYMIQSLCVKTLQVVTILVRSSHDQDLALGI